MTEPSALLVLKRGESRCYQHMADILTFTALAIGGHNVLFAAPQKARYACLTGDCDLSAPLDGFDDAISSGAIPDTIYLFKDPKRERPETAQAIRGLTSVTLRIVGAVFAVFVDEANEWVKENVSTDYYNWPPISNFARLIRNAIVHGGTINLKDPKAHATWQGLAISAKDYGAPVLSGGILSLGDLMLLMIDLDFELDTLGAPLSLD